MTDEIDAIIAEAGIATPEPIAIEHVTPEEETPAEPAPDAPAEIDEPWPKKAQNAMAKAKAKEAKLKFQIEQANAALRAAEARFNTPKQEVPKTDGAPKETDFQTYAEFLEAKTTWQMDNKLAERDKAQQANFKQQQDQQSYVQMAQEAHKQAEEFTASNAEAAQLFEEHDDIMSECPDNIVRIFVESGNASLAAYNLIKAGKLEEVMSMSPNRAAIEIGKALAMIAPPKAQTKAPTPITPAKGTGAGSKSPSNMSADDLMKWVYS